MSAKRKPNNYYVKNGVAYVELRNCDKQLLCDAEDWEKLKDTTWHYDSGYVKAKKNNKTIKIHRIIMNAPIGMEVDHINHDPLDNRKSNLRVVTHMVNMANRGRQSNNKTGMNGVFKMKSNNRFYAQINVNGKRKYLGCYKTLEEAKSARIRAEYLCLIPFIEERTADI